LRTSIYNIDGTGIRIHKGNRTKIKGCEILKCLTGIEIVSANASILMNKLRQNFENGIVTLAKNNLRCDSIIKFNEVEKNKENGIVCAGN
jgi:phage gp45-like